MKNVPQNGHRTPTPPLPNPVPQTQICCTGESDVEQHKTSRAGDESPPPHHATAPRDRSVPGSGRTQRA